MRVFDFVLTGELVEDDDTIDALADWLASTPPGFGGGVSVDELTLDGLKFAIPEAYEAFTAAIPPDTPAEVLVTLRKEIMATRIRALLKAARQRIESEPVN